MVELKTLTIFSAVLIPVLAGFSNQPCIPLSFGADSVVCVCNATYCDFVGTIGPEDQKPNSYLTFTTTKDGQRLNRQRHTLVPMKRSYLKKFTMIHKNALIMELDHNTTYQTILGFGGAFTDATGYNILNLTMETQDNLLKSYFAPEGIEYNMGRIPIGGSDFSTRPYTYDDSNENDFNLTNWSLQDEDTNYKIPIITRAMKMSLEPLTFLASPWSAPSWMKTSNSINKNGTLKGSPGDQYYQTWANYFVKFLDAYKSEGINIWGLTVQNEPTDGMIYNFPFNAMGYTYEMERDFIKLNLGPTLEKNNYGDIKLIVLDDNRLLIPEWIKEVLKDPDTAKYVSGIGVHWYMNYFVPAEVLNLTHHNFPDKFLLATEACEGWAPWEIPKVILGSWRRAENYANDIAEDLLNWVTGWVDWNMCLNMEGGPNWAKNFVDSPIIVDGDKDQFYKQPMFYALAHYSKFIKPGSVRIRIKSADLPEHLTAVAFDGPDKSTVLVIINRSEDTYNLAITDHTLNGLIEEDVAPHSIQTYIWWKS